jgi:hypothetical protein
MMNQPGDAGASQGPNASVPFGEAAVGDQLQGQLQEGRPRQRRPDQPQGAPPPATPAPPAQPAPPVMTPDRVNSEVFSPRPQAAQAWREGLGTLANSGPYPNLRALADHAGSAQ